MIQLLVAVAGGLGAIARFIMDAQVARFRVNRLLPLGTFVINVTGSLLLGLITGWWVAHGGDPVLRQGLGVGFLGGYTTFSIACVESVRLARAGRSWAMVTHAAGMLVLSVAAAGLGYWIGAIP